VCGNEEGFHCKHDKAEITDEMWIQYISWVYRKEKDWPHFNISEKLLPEGDIKLS